jgi:hypothetical protein
MATHQTLPWSYTPKQVSVMLAAPVESQLRHIQDRRVSDSTLAGARIRVRVCFALPPNHPPAIPYPHPLTYPQQAYHAKSSSRRSWRAMAGTLQKPHAASLLGLSLLHILPSSAERIPKPNYFSHDTYTCWPLVSRSIPKHPFFITSDSINRTTVWDASRRQLSLRAILIVRRHSRCASR